MGFNRKGIGHLNMKQSIQIPKDCFDYPRQHFPLRMNQFQLHWTVIYTRITAVAKILFHIQLNCAAKEVTVDDKWKENNSAVDLTFSCWSWWDRHWRNIRGHVSNIHWTSLCTGDWLHSPDSSTCSFGGSLSKGCCWWQLDVWKVRHGLRNHLLTHWDSSLPQCSIQVFNHWPCQTNKEHDQHSQASSIALLQTPSLCCPTRDKVPTENLLSCPTYLKL